MRAVRFDSYGDLDVLNVVEVARPEPGRGQLLVAVRAAGINPGEAKIRTGALHERWPASFPEGQGSDFAGTVAALGPDVTNFAVGDEILGYTNNRASHAEFVVANEDEVVAKPAELDWPRAGSLFIVGTSAYALVHAAEVRQGEVVVVSAAAGGVGSLTAQWARNLGATVIGLAGPANHEWLRGFGVVPVEYAAPDLAGRVRAALAGRTVDAVLDTHGPEYVQLGFDLGVPARRIATIADFAAAERGATVVQHYTVASPPVLSEIADALATGQLQMPIAATYPLERVRDAYRQLEQGHTRGKIVLLP
jgi:NADPH:quinone reductase-like Zn-dependent oxidoreductase